MNNPAPLSHVTTLHELRPALSSLCTGVGALSRLDILPVRQGGRRSAICFIRMDSAEQDIQLMKKLGAGRFGGDVVLVVDLESGFAC